MSEHFLTAEQITAYQAYLREEERSEATVKKYRRDLEALVAWLIGHKAANLQKTSLENPQRLLITKEAILAFRGWLLQKGRAPGTVNGALSAINGFFRFLGWSDCCVRFLKVQRKLFRSRSRQLNRGEYERLLSTAETQGRRRLLLLMETICATGIRVSEAQYITLEAIHKGCAQILLKGKIRTILLPEKLCRKLKKYALNQGITAGPLFCTRRGKPLSRNQIWAEMKSLCEAAGVERTKVFPHNLRHLFAVSFYRVCKDIVRLADVLGHSSIETTRIYLISTGEEYAKELDRLGLVH